MNENGSEFELERLSVFWRGRRLHLLTRYGTTFAAKLGRRNIEKITEEMLEVSQGRFGFRFLIRLLLDVADNQQTPEFWVGIKSSLAPLDANQFSFGSYK